MYTNKHIYHMTLTLKIIITLIFSKDIRELGLNMRQFKREMGEMNIYLKGSV